MSAYSMGELADFLFPPVDAIGLDKADEIPTIDILASVSLLGVGSHRRIPSPVTHNKDALFRRRLLNGDSNYSVNRNIDSGIWAVSESRLSLLEKLVD